MLEPTHRFQLSVRDTEGREVTRERAEPLQTVYEDLLFEAVLAGDVPNDGTSPRAILEPDYNDGKVVGVRGTLLSRTKSYSLDIFGDQAARVLTDKDLVERTGGASLTWDVDARALSAEERAKRPRATLVREPFPLRSDLSTPIDIQESPGDRPGATLFVASALAQELKQATASSLERERADALTGYVVTNADAQTSIVLRGRIPFPETADASATHYAFTPEAFAGVHGEHRRRGGNESLVGWHHNHPPPCGRDCLAHIPACDTATVFLSLDDRAVFRSSFSAPYQVGLVSGKASQKHPQDPVIRAYAWRSAVLEEISYVVF